MSTAAYDAWTNLRAVINNAELARRLGISRAAVHQWPEVPADRVLDVEAATRIPRWELRPDLYAQPRELMPWHRGLKPS